jgi:uncharacterized protein (DUF2147 family)
MTLWACTAFAQPAGGIEGRWLTYDSAKAKRALVEIRRQGPGFKGVVVEMYRRAGEDADPVCKECPGEARGKPIRGLEILTLESARSASEFKGKILDPEVGKEYSSTAVLEAGGQRLVLHGYVLLPWFGRDETWTRAP